MGRRAVTAQLKAEILDAITKHADAQQPLNALDDLRRLWRTFVVDFRMLCLTEDPASASMWNHYAGGFTGAVLEFACIDALDSPWLAARAVTYTTSVAEMFSAGEIAEIILMPERQACETILERGTFRKSPEWSNEREWRVMSSKRPGESADYSDYPFNPAELSTVYLGPRISAQDRDALVASASALPHLQVIQVEIGAGHGFRFTRIRSGASSG